MSLTCRPPSTFAHARKSDARNPKKRSRRRLRRLDVGGKICCCRRNDSEYSTPPRVLLMLPMGHGRESWVGSRPWEERQSRTLVPAAPCKAHAPACNWRRPLALVHRPRPLETRLPHETGTVEAEHSAMHVRPLHRRREGRVASASCSCSCSCSCPCSCSCSCPWPCFVHHELLECGGARKKTCVCCFQQGADSM